MTTAGPFADPATVLAHVAVTGAAGLLGAAFCARLLAADTAGLTALTRGPLPPALATAAGLRHIRTDTLFAAGWAADLPADATLIHCAGLSNPRQSFDGFAAVLRDHVLPHLDMVARLVAMGWRGRLIYLSSGGAIYGEPKTLPIAETHPLAPISFYGMQKLCIERGLNDLARRHGFGLITLRVSNPYGVDRIKPGQGVIPLLIAALRQHRLFGIIGDGTALRDYVHIDDLWGALALCLTAALPKDGVLTLNIGSGQGTSLNALIAQLEALTGQRLHSTHQPVEYDVASNVLDCTRARDALGWQPRVDLRDGLRRTLDILHDDAG